MRQIKFRAKRIDNGEWVTGHYTQGTESNHYITRPDGSVWEVIHETLGQFTGLTDENGKEIYEGDVIRYYQPYAEITETHTVKWDEKWACFGLFETGNKWCKESDWVKIKDIEIISNI